MLLVAHIIIALGSIAASTASLIAPSLNRLRLSYGLVAATLASGTYLVISTHAQILSSCITGLAYTGLVLSLITVARYKLNKDQIQNN
ncbi:hypothetical protein KW801_02665 [Candidatus Saccharibacteria bacterium]|nr:hypothetical protein [Candidatus Saccharibacteria bacterium]